MRPGSPSNSLSNLCSVLALALASSVGCDDVVVYPLAEHLPEAGVEPSDAGAPADAGDAGDARVE